MRELDIEQGTVNRLRRTVRSLRRQLADADARLKSLEEELLVRDAQMTSLQQELDRVR
jgi:chromosome segregation ATPase